jgi:hypothetical protein
MSGRAIFPPLAIGTLGIAAGLVQAGADPKRALYAYATGFAVALTVALGALLFVMIAHTARARWFVVLRRLAGAMAATLPLFLVLFLPIALGVRRLYPWAGPAADLDAAQRAWAAHARPWLNVPFFLVRSYVYLTLWTLVSVLLRRASLEGDVRPSVTLVQRERRISAAGLPVMALTLTFAAFDWIMSLNSRWSSDMMGLYLFAGAFAGAIGSLAVVAFAAFRSKRLPVEVGPAHFHALGRVLLVSVIFWAYIGFCQFLLVWIADMARESSFYVDRSRGGWGWVAAVLVVSHFVLPFLLLLSRDRKRDPSRLALVGAWLVCAHALDVYWLVLPTLHAGLGWLDPAFIVGIFGMAAAFGVWRFLAAPAVPIHDPALAESLRYESP